MIRILLYGEGKHDRGHEVWREKRREWIREEGWMQPLIRRCLQEDVEFTVRNRWLVPLPHKRKNTSVPRGLFEKARTARLIAHREGFDMVVFMVDADTTCKKQWQEKYDKICQGFAAIQNHVRSVPCLPMSASESWLLADPTAWEKQGLDDPSALPQKPEEIWGQRSDPEGNHPHPYFARVCRQAGCGDHRDTRYALAEDSAIETMGAKCPVSFQSFTRDIRDINATSPRAD